MTKTEGDRMSEKEARDALATAMAVWNLLGYLAGLMR